MFTTKETPKLPVLEMGLQNDDFSDFVYLCGIHFSSFSNFSISCKYLDSHVWYAYFKSKQIEPSTVCSQLQISVYELLYLSNFYFEILKLTFSCTFACVFFGWIYGSDFEQFSGLFVPSWIKIRKSHEFAYVRSFL